MAVFRTAIRTKIRMDIMKDYSEIEKIIDDLRVDSAIKNKKGIAFIGASIFVWFIIFIISILNFNTVYIWFGVATLMPIAMAFTRLSGIKLKNDENPLNKVGFLFTLNEILYILIACYIQSIHPEKLIMILAMIFGGHLLPFGWLYKSNMYTFSSVFVTIASLIVGILFKPWAVALFMMVYEIVFTIVLYYENKQLINND